MDCLEYMRALPDESVDVGIFDPPYGVDHAGNRYFDDSLRYIKTHIDEWFAELYRVLKPGRHIYIYAPTLNLDIFIAAFKKQFVFKNLLVARAKTGCKQAIGAFKHDAQYVIFGSKGKPRLLKRVDIQRKSDVWMNDPRNTDPNPYSYLYSSFLDDRANAEVKNHPNAKNVMQIRKFILLSSNPGEVVLDPFAGGGAVARAAIAEGRNYYTCDLVDYGINEEATRRTKGKAA